uniref:Uncharacterized protein n=1 Tax=Arundo donax TaxID=35708 RepID=A0A0A9CIK3_ARUDO
MSSWENIVSRKLPHVAAPLQYNNL